MTTRQELFKELEQRERKLLGMGGPDEVARQHERKKLTARERLALLFDEGSFQELDMLVRHRATGFGLDKLEIPADGVITGHGLISGRPAFAYAQDFTARGGTLGEAHAQKIVKVMDLAMKVGAPIIGINDGGGARIQEGIDALKGYGDIFLRNSWASGVIPQISAIMGPTAGGGVYSPAMTDWVFMVKGSSYMFITGPDVIKQVTGEEISFEDLGGADAHTKKSGVAHFASESDQDCIERMKELLSYLPQNNMEDPPRVDLGDDPAREDPELDSLIPEDTRKAYDVKRVIHSFCDAGAFLEPQPDYAPNLVIAFGRMNGRTVGFIANQAAYLAGVLDVNSSDKAARFIRFCDAFNIPLITLADNPGYLPGTDQEWTGIIRHGAKLLWSYAEATVPKITVILRKDYGGAYIAMCSRHLGADFAFAWPTAEIAVMGAEPAAQIIHRREIQAAEDKAKKLQEKVAEYQALLYNPYIAASRGYVDAVIRPSQTRRRIIESLDLLSTKRESRPAKKHGNIPM
ncbi:MAG: methylmalonyl-CoA carboxyltransferase [Chloroflexi bacterium]|nr:methylmalonyl-CoA carboxyltransferase [Chloroflexota bacterium]